ncbi:MAG: aspartate aminotransferase family protein, partial [Bacteroidia bacterium]
MISQRQLFLNHLAQTSPTPLGLEIEKAEGVYMFATDGRKYIDMISGISVSNVGHRHPHVLQAINDQLDKYMHLMVYGEFIQSPQIKLAQNLTSLLPASLSSCYFVNSGSEAVEGALKLAKRYTGRTNIVSFKNAYHGSTAGALSVMGNETFKQAFRPLLPGINFGIFNDERSVELINEDTACVIIEPIQAEAGVIKPHDNFLTKLRTICNKTGSLLIFDEAQCGFGRTGTFFAFEQFDAIPDILILAKGMGGGMPIGAFISSKKIMSTLTENPVLGHITTFGGHPVSCAASLACIEVIENEKLIETVKEKSELIKENINSTLIKTKRNSGLLLSFECENEEICKKTIDNCIKSGVLTDWFLFNSKCMRIAPPLT